MVNCDLGRKIMSPISWKLFEIFSQNFTEMLTSIRRHAEHKNHNVVFLILELWPFEEGK